MKFHPLSLEGAFILEPEKIFDKRGFFSRIFDAKIFSEISLESSWVHINNSFNRNAGTLRGLHFQHAPKGEVKLVRCISGAVWDVIVDLRKDSSTFGKWTGSELTAENRLMIYVPKGFAHGFITLVDDSELIYFASEEYSATFEGGVHWNDPEIAIDWPIHPTLISDRDVALPTLSELIVGR